MIIDPDTDEQCLDAITASARRLTQRPVADQALLELAMEYKTPAAVAAWIRSQPQRDDLSNPYDGPKVKACDPWQRLRLHCDDPNCVERAFRYVVLGELLDPMQARQLRTDETDLGRHTYPLENGEPVVLNPNASRNCMHCVAALSAPGPVMVDPHDAVSWSEAFALDGAGPIPRNGEVGSRMLRASRALKRLLVDGRVPAPSEVEDMGVLFALAERAASCYPNPTLAVIRTTALAVGELIDEVIARRNVGIDIGGTKLETPKWVDSLATAAGHVGIDVGAALLRKKMAAYGIDSSMVGLVENELNREGLSLGPLAHPPQMPTIGPPPLRRPQPPQEPPPRDHDRYDHEPADHEPADHEPADHEPADHEPANDNEPDDRAERAERADYEHEDQDDDELTLDAA